MEAVTGMDCTDVRAMQGILWKPKNITDDFFQHLDNCLYCQEWVAQIISDAPAKVKRHFTACFEKFRKGITE